mgnify:FL=1
MTDPFKIEGPACISFSGGRSRAYMLWRVLQAYGGNLPKDVAVCFANTGKEDPRTLDFVNDCRWKWGVNIHWLEFEDNFAQGGDGVRVVDYQSASREGEPFEALIKRKSYLPNAVTRFCTSDLKIKPIETFLRRTWGELEMVVGIRADEPRRIAKMPHLHKPLALAGIGKADVMAFWRQQPFDLMAEDGNCDLCFNKALGILMSSIRKKPRKAVWWAKQEEFVGARFAKDRPTYAQMHANALRQQDAFGYDEETIACFCGD